MTTEAVTPEVWAAAAIGDPVAVDFETFYTSTYSVAEMGHWAYKGKDEIAAELKSAFKLSDSQAAKITRRVLGRARFFQRALSLVTGK